MNRITAGIDYTFDFTLYDGDGGRFELAPSTVTFVARTPGGTAVLTHTLTVNALGVETVSDGLAVGSAGHSSGELVQTLTATETDALPAGLLTWSLTLVDGAGKTSVPLQGQWLVSHATYVDSGLTRRALRRRIADRLGDMVILEATSASASVSTFVDALNISGASDSLTGRQLVVVSGQNAGHVARIQATNESTSTISMAPPAPNLFAAGDIVEVYNERSRGWTVAEYNRVINDAIADTWPLSAAMIVAELPVEFGEDAPTIPVPDVMHEVCQVEWQEPETGLWVPLRADLWYGWSADHTGTISVRGLPANRASGRVLRVTGYGPHPTLQSDLDQTALNPEWLTAECAYRLSVSGLDRDTARGNTVLLHQREREAMRSRIRTMRREHTVRVRG